MEEFAISTYLKITYSVVVAVIIGFAILGIETSHSQIAPVIFGFLLMLPLSMIALLLTRISRKIIVTVDNIISANVFLKKELPTDSIRGVRIGDKHIVIESASASNPKITIMGYSDFEDSECLVNWLRENFKDLDAVDLENDQNEILKDTKLGFTESEREERLALANRIATVYNVSGLIIGLASIFLRDNYFVVILSIVFPLLAIIAMIWSRGLIKLLSNKKRSVHPNLLLGFFFPIAMALGTTLVGYDIFEFKNFWPIGAIVWAVFMVLLLAVGINKKIGVVVGQVVFIVAFSAFYSFGSIMRMNCVFDKSTPQVYSATVLAHRIESGKNKTYNLTLSPWGPRKEIREITVRRGLYDEVPVGGKVKVSFKQGLFKIPWFTVSD